MTKTPKCAAVLAMLVLGGCEDAATRRQPLPIVLQPDKGEPVTLQIPRGYIEEPKDPEGPLPTVLLRIPAENFSGAQVFVPKSEVRLLIEPNAGKADAGRARQAAALRRSRAAEDAIRKSDELSKPGLIAYSFPNGKEEAESYYFTSASGDVFVDCWKSVCKAYKTWKKRVHLRFDYQPVKAADVAAVDTSIDQMVQSFTGDASSGP